MPSSSSTVASVVDGLHTAVKIRGGYLHISLMANMIQNAIKPLASYSDRPMPNRLTIGEAVCLLWQDSETGEVGGRKACLDRKCAVLASLFVDLVSMKRITLTECPGRLYGQNLLVEVTSTAATAHPAQDLLLQRLSKSSEPLPLNSWLRRLYLKSGHYVTALFDSLVSRGILSCEKNNTYSSVVDLRVYPTVDPTWKQTLIEQVRATVFDGASTTEFHTAVLLVARIADKPYYGHPILEHVFTPEELAAGAKQHIRNSAGKLKSSSDSLDSEGTSLLSIDKNVIPTH